jgi:uridine kinase
MKIHRTEKRFKAVFEDGRTLSLAIGTTLTEILETSDNGENKDIVLANVGNRILGLHEPISTHCKIKWLTMLSPEGVRAYQQTLCLVLIRAAREILPKSELLIDHSLGKGLYCEFKDRSCRTSLPVNRIRKRMRRIIDADELIRPARQKGKAFLRSLTENAWTGPLMETNFFIPYRCCGITETMGYPLLPSTGRLKAFDLRLWAPGLILRYPEETDCQSLPPFVKQKNLFSVFNETRKWENILGIATTADINGNTDIGTLPDLIKIAEGLHEKKIVAVADQITRKKRKLRVVLIAGPSSSGKTTFSKRLSIQLRVNGLVPYALSVDDYFLDNAVVPKNERGKPDFESISALDLTRFNADLLALMQGKTVKLPRFDFMTGKSAPGPLVKLDKSQPILIEGLHALNDELTSAVPRENKFKLYVSALTHLNITNALRVSTSDLRLVRRLVRDHQFRNHSASFTLGHWREVREGEEKYIFPFQETADAIFNSSLPYEVGVLRPLAQTLLERVPEKDAAYPEARRLLEFLHFFRPVPKNEVPFNSILREFIGGSSFVY